MKKWIIVLVMCLIATTVYAGAFDAQDKEAEKVARFMEKMLGEDFEAGVKETYPHADNFTWDAQTVAGPDTIYIIAVEAIDDGAPLYWYFELQLNVINGNPELEEKYGL